MNIIPFCPKRYLPYPIGVHMGETLKYIDEVIPYVKKLVGSEPLNIWVRGSSGAILAALLCSRLDNTCYIQHVKKDGESSHHTGISYTDSDYNIILDDFCRTGSTLGTNIHLYTKQLVSHSST